MGTTAYELTVAALRASEPCDPFWPEKTARHILRDLQRAALPGEAATRRPGWPALIRELLAEADRVDAVWQADDERRHLEYWKTIRPKLEAAGARVTQTEEDQWDVSIARRGALFSVNVRTGFLDMRHFGERYIFEEYLDLEREVRREIAQRDECEAEEGRKRELRRTHRYEPKRRAWVPHDGKGDDLRWSKKAKAYTRVPPDTT